MKAMSGDMAKRRVMRKLQKENDHMLHRLKNAEKTYCSATMRKEEAWRQKVLHRMCDQRLNAPPQSPIIRPSSSNAALRPGSANRHISPPVPNHACIQTTLMIYNSSLHYSSCHPATRTSSFLKLKLEHVIFRIHVSTSTAV